MRALKVSIDAVWMAVAVALPAVLTLLSPLGTVDLAYKVRTGDMIIAQRALPAVDTFTFSAVGAPWAEQQWGSAVALALGFAPAGWSGLLVVAAALVAATSALLLVACRWMGAAPRTAAILTILAYVVAFGGLALRAQLFGVLCFAAVLALVAGRSRSPRLFLAVPLVILAWANLHGSFPFGILAIGWALLEDAAARRPAWRRDAVVLALAALATCVTPFGPAVWAYAAGLAASPTVTSLVAEWQPVSIRSPVGIVVAVSAVGIGIALVIRRRRVTWPTILWLAGLLLASLWTQRAVVWWALGAATAIAGVLAAEPGTELEPGPGREGRVERWLSAAAQRHVSVVNGVLAIGIAAVPIILGLLVPLRPADPATGSASFLRDAPGGVTAAVQAAVKPGTRILNAQRWGSWLEWAVPSGLVFVDSRIEVFPPEVWDDYRAVSAGRFDWGETVERIGPDLIVASRQDQPSLIDAIAADPSSGWRQVYADADGVVFARTP